MRGRSVFYSALLCLSSAAVLRFEELAQLPQRRQQVKWTLVANSLKSSGTLLHIPCVEHQRQCNMSRTATSEILKKKHAAVTCKNSSSPQGVDSKTA